MNNPNSSCSRRSFLGNSLGCGAFLMLGLSAAPVALQRAFAAPTGFDVQHKEPFARVEKLADGVWAVVSTPFESGDMTTFSNGGIIAGSDKVLAVEGFNTPKGGRWLSDLSLELAGKRPDYVVLTHFHPDHSNGLAGYLAGGKEIAVVSTTGSRALLAERQARPELSKAEGLQETGGHVLLPDTLLRDEAGSTSVDLGGKVVRLTARKGHTPSDLTIELMDPHVIWTGDLCFNGVFPYYGDAIPSELSKTCNELLTKPGVVYVPGHGSLARAEDLKTYLALLEEVERAARAAHEKGIPPDRAWETFAIPQSLGEWRNVFPDMPRYAFQAWEKELAG